MDLIRWRGVLGSGEQGPGSENRDHQPEQQDPGARLRP
jgi:hypothetical protein